MRALAARTKTAGGVGAWWGERGDRSEDHPLLRASPGAADWGGASGSGWRRRGPRATQLLAPPPVLEYGLRTGRLAPGNAGSAGGAQSQVASFEAGLLGWRTALRIPSSALSPGLGESRVGGCCERQPAPTPPSPQWGARGQVCVEGVRRRRKGPRAQRSRWAERQRASLPVLASASNEKVTLAARRGLTAGLGGAGLGGRRLRGGKSVLAES